MTGRRRRQYRWYWPTLACAIVFLGAAIRCASLPKRSWWIDELITRDVARLPIWKSGAASADMPAMHSIFAYTMQDTGPGPLAYLLDGMLANFAEPMGREHWLRVPGIVAGVLTIVLLLRRLRWWGCGRGGVLAAGALCALLPLHIDFSIGARGYAWGCLLTFVQFDLLLRLSRIINERGSAKLLWTGFVSAGAAGILLNPIHAVGAVAALVGAVYGLKKGFVLTAQLGKRFIIISTALISSPAIAWMLIWLAHLQQQQLGGAIAGEMDFSLRQFGHLLHQRWVAVSLVCGLAVFWVCLQMWRVRSLRPVICGFLTCAFLSVPLLLALEVLFVSAPRYFYYLLVPLICSAGWTTAASIRNLRYRIGGNNIAWASGVVLILLLTFGVAAFNAASTPVHNWREAVLWLRDRARPGDVVICGPNSDRVILVTYARAANLPVAIPRDIESSHGRQDLATIAGLSSAISSGERIWFITPFWGAVRPQSYWKLIESSFVEKARMPGRQQIRIFLRHPQGAAGSL